MFTPDEIDEQVRDSVNSAADSLEGWIEAELKRHRVVDLPTGTSSAVAVELARRGRDDGWRVDVEPMEKRVWFSRRQWWRLTFALNKEGI